MSKLYCTRHDYYLEECPECIEDAAIKAERDKYRAALEKIAAGALPDGDIVPQPVCMFAEEVLGQ